ncbi:hypothetical protein [Caldimonas sp. KR1-144]|uniref:hypothetical protein n=1 Tax=Caldimonas sp. KR1-144 TaxID=3400911 RepID=UPI003C09F436
MPEIAYPTSLPGPGPGVLTPRPRRAGSTIEGNRQLRPRQRDFAGAIHRYPFTYTPEEMAAWRSWYRGSLINGRRWFSIALPGGGGVITRVARYLNVSEVLLPSGNFRVTATLEQRGAAMPPQATWSIGKEEFWKYRVELLGSGADYSSAEYNDIAWPIAQAPFGDGPHPYHAGVWPDPNTIVPLNRAIWMRRSEFLPVLDDIAIHVKADNAPTLWINGEPVTLVQQGAYPDPDEFLYEATYTPTSEVLVFVLRVIDDEGSEPGDHIYADLAAEYL